jgi:hypothetical protein
MFLLGEALDQICFISPYFLMVNFDILLAINWNLPINQSISLEVIFQTNFLSIEARFKNIY